jgi:dTDP-4-dehydrorhamnose reductase
MINKILMTGGDGTLGREIQKEISAYCPTISEMNICDLVETINVIRKINPEVIIHCAAYTDVQKAEEEKERCYNINVIGIKNITFVAKAINSKLVYISTDYVYEGISGNYNVKDEPKPINFYAKTKYWGELEIMAWDKSLIIRTSFKKSPWPYDKAFIDKYTSCDYVEIIAPKIICAIKKFIKMNTKTPITINIGTERKSIYELAKRSRQDVIPISIKDIDGVILPYDTSMKLSEKWIK